METMRLAKQLMNHFGELTDKQLMGLTMYGEARGEYGDTVFNLFVQLVGA
jgi:hypothetical protein